LRYRRIAQIIPVGTVQSGLNQLRELGFCLIQIVLTHHVLHTPSVSLVGQYPAVKVYRLLLQVVSH